MADLAIVDSSVGEREAEISSTHPLALDAIWSSISMHLTTNEWLRVARTCKASWDAQLPHILLTEHTPVAAYSFVLERCQAASFMSVEVEATDANYAVKDALSSTSMLKSVKQLIVAAEGHCGINTQIGFHFYDACPNLQVVSLKGFFVQKGWCPRPSIRHLELETGIANLLKFTDWQAFPQLETLTLCAWRSQQSPINSTDLDLSSAQSLGRLQIENWSPKSIKVAACCRVYAVWQPPANASAAKRLTVHSWLRSPCWRAPGTKLAALHIEHRSLLWEEAIPLSTIRAILECQQELETLNIATERLGSPVELLNILFFCFEGMKTPLKVDMSTEAGCFLHPDDTLCSSKTLGLTVKGPVLIPMQAASGRLYSHLLEGSFASDAEVGPPFKQDQLSRDSLLDIARYKKLLSPDVEE